ncbi:hypothetical protein GTO91_06510 [Heliobacterium undosum]|uniref:Uncharacterized protein n=1 Tax=Heliomicrobium undosum TaxID=121734 RepID=A0A845KZ98_9FIRM|nr:hypothetical protein [Heliomicrobium undosum]MZP29357.1 hypothetical protein [Heliomicrobium undosum]
MNQAFREGSTTPVCFKFVDCTAMTAPTTVMIPIPESSMSTLNYTVRCCAVECMA